MNKYLKTLFAAALVVGFSSCLKDKEFENNEYGITNLNTNKVVELGILASPSHINSVAIDFVDAPIDVVAVTVRVAGENPVTEDVTVTLDTTGTNDFITKYNLDNDVSIVRFPNAFYTTPAAGLKVTIPAGSREATLVIKTNAFQFDPSSTYGLHFKIASVDKPGYVISGNFGDYFMTIGAKNDYDGRYEITGTLVDANGLYKGDYGDPAGARVYDLVTTGANTGLFYDVSYDYPNYIVVNIATGGAANTGIRPSITFDPATRAVASVINANNTAQVAVIGAGSKFNDSDHSIDLEWTIGRWHATEHWKYLGSR